MADETELRAAVQSALGALGDLTVQVEILPSGAVFLDIEAPDGAVVELQGAPDGSDWGISRLLGPGLDLPFVGHDRGAASLADALVVARELLTHRPE